jgi:chromatin remodeling complex protein RSC6
MSSTKMSSNKQMPKSASAPVAAAAPAAAEKKAAAPRRQKAAEAAPVAAPNQPVPAAPAVVEAVRAESVESAAPADSLVSRLNEVIALASALKKDILAREKTHARALRAATSKKARKQQRDANAPPRKPSGITKPMAISKELQVFLGTKDGELVSRVDAARIIYQYAREHNLLTEENKRKIVPDAALTKLLGLKSTDELTTPTIQRFITRHFPPSQQKQKA